MNWKFLIIAVVFYLAVSALEKLANKRKQQKQVKEDEVNDRVRVSIADSDTEQ